MIAALEGPWDFHLAVAERCLAGREVLMQPAIRHKGGHHTRPEEVPGRLKLRAHPEGVVGTELHSRRKGHGGGRCGHARLRHDRFASHPQRRVGERPALVEGTLVDITTRSGCPEFVNRRARTEMDTLVSAVPSQKR
jgi:hypothetical protein